MHILEIPSFFPPYGALFCLDQAKALKALGHEVRILSNVQLGATTGLRNFLRLPYGRYEHEMDGITVYQSYHRGVPKMIRHNVSRWVAIVQSMFTDYVKQYGKPDILHAHCAKWAGYAAMLIGRQYGIPYVITEHLPKEVFEVEFGPAPSSAWALPCLKEAYEKAVCVITVSEELFSDIACYFGKSYCHQAIPNIIDVDFFAYRERVRKKDSPFRFCCPAIFVARKGYDVLFRAFDLLTQTEPNVRLSICGQGTDGKSCRRMVQGMTCREKVDCLGVLDKTGVRQLLYDSDALVLASRGESQGLVLLEAMSTGIPALSTKAIPASVRLSSGLQYVDIDDAEALMHEMLLAVRTPLPHGRQLSAQVRQFAASEVIGAKIASLFQNVLSERAVPRTS